MQAARPERWFVAQGQRRIGPVSFDHLIHSLLREAEPRAPFVWRKGFAHWTRAEDVPEVERRIAPVLARAAEATGAVRRPTAPAIQVQAGAGTIADEKPGSPMQVYGGLSVGVVILGLVGWLFWPRPQPTTPQPAFVIHPAPQTTPPVAPVPEVSPNATRSPAPASTPRPVTALVDREADLPPAEVRRLRGVATWSGQTLGLTVENRTAWRVTALYVRVSRYAGDDFEEDKSPLLLLPPAGRVAPGVADLLDRVAPDRKKPGLNPLDTGLFEAKAGPSPDGFRWQIESARGYAPR